MIKLENYEVVGWEHAIRGMRNPMNSWEKSDSGWDAHIPPIELRNQIDWADYAKLYICVQEDSEYSYDIGPDDASLMKKLRNAGTDHRKFMRMITVYVDITAPLYWWKEFDTYKVGTVANSCSTMHKIHEKEFTIEDFSCEYLSDSGVLAVDNPYIRFTSLEILQSLINVLNAARNRFIETKEKIYWWQMIQLLPTSYNQKRTITLNYEVLANMYKSRKAHKLDEWREFCKWIEQLPYAELIVGPSLSDIPIAHEIMAEAERRVKEKEHKTEIAYICDGESCNSCNNIDCNHTLDINHAVNFEKVGDHKYMEVERSPLAHPETYVSDAIAMIGDMTRAQRVEVMKYLNVKTPNKCPYWNYENQTSSHTCNGCEDHGVLVNGDRYCTLVGGDE